jgi:hypothetical protein
MLPLGYRIRAWFGDHWLCWEIHYCVCCDLTAIPPGHMIRGQNRWRFSCAKYFHVRCLACQRVNCTPDPKIYKMHYEMTREEHITKKSNDGRKFVFEVL